jgi:hypothetical protein
MFAPVCVVLSHAGAHPPCLPVDPVSVLLAPDLAEYDRFGSGLAAGDGVVVAGSFPFDTRFGALPKVYVFDVSDPSSPVWLRSFRPESDGANDGFGFNLAVSNGIVVSSASADDQAGHLAGAVYLYDAWSGQLLNMFAAPDTGIGDRFGSAVAMGGTLLAVGAEQADQAGGTSGVVYVFDINDPEEPVLLYRLKPDIPDASTRRFGAALDIDGTDLIVGTSAGIEPGTAFLFDLNTGEQRHRWSSGLDLGADSFGSAVAVRNGRAAVGAWYEINGFSVAGAVYVFDTATGDFLYRLVGDDPPSDGTPQGFGISVDLDNEHLLVGTLADTDQQTRMLKVYLFDAATGARRSTLFNKRGEPSWFGYRVSLMDGYAVISSLRDSMVERWAGAVQIFAAHSADPCPADFAEPSCVLDLADLVAFVTLFQAQDPASDFAPPYGTFDLADVEAFVDMFEAGCP